MNINGRRGSVVLVIALAVLVVLLATGGLWYYEAHKAQQPPLSTNIASSTPGLPGMTAASTSTTYQSTDYGISFAYPNAWTVKPGDTAEWKMGNTVVGDYGLYTKYDPGAVSLITVEIPPSLYPGTNLKGAYFNLSVDKKLGQSQCLALTSEPGPNNGGGTITIDGVAFNWTAASGAAAGTYEFTENYSGYANGTCYEFNIGDTTGNDVSPTGTRQSGSANDIPALEALLPSVKFTGSIPSAIVSASTPSIPAAQSAPTPQGQAAFSCSYEDATSVGVILQASFPSYIDTSNIEALSSGEDNPIINEDQTNGLFCIKARKASVDTLSLADKKTGNQIWTTVINPQKGQQYTIDVNSTVVGVLFITPYFYTSDPAKAEVILSAITKDPGIPTLAQDIQSNPNFITDFTSSSTQIGALFQTVVQRVLSGLTTTTQFTSSTPAVKITSPTGGDTWSARASTQYEITWMYQGLSASDQAQLYLYFPNGTQCGFSNGPVGAGGSDNAYVILPSIGCSGSTERPVLTPGRYSIAIVVQDASGKVLAANQSDWFNITQ